MCVTGTFQQSGQGRIGAFRLGKGSHTPPPPRTEPIDCPVCGERVAVAAWIAHWRCCRRETVAADAKVPAYACPGRGFTTDRFADLAAHRERELGPARDADGREREALTLAATHVHGFRWALERSGAGKAALPVVRVLSVLELSAWASLRLLQDWENAEHKRIEAWLGSKERTRDLKAVGIDGKQFQGLLAGVPRLEIAPGARLDGPALAVWVKELDRAKPLRLSARTIGEALASLEAGDVSKAMEIAGMPTRPALPAAPFDADGMLVLPTTKKELVVVKLTCGCGAVEDEEGNIIRPGLRHKHGWRKVRRHQDSCSQGARPNGLAPATPRPAEFREEREAAPDESLDRMPPPSALRTLGDARAGTHDTEEGGAAGGDRQTGPREKHPPGS